MIRVMVVQVYFLRIQSRIFTAREVRGHSEFWGGSEGAKGGEIQFLINEDLVKIKSLRPL